MNATTVDIKDILITSDLNLVLGKNLFIGKEPDSPKICTTLYDISNLSPIWAFDGEIRNEKMQVRVKHTHYQAAYDLINSIGDHLIKLSNFVINDTKYLYIKINSGPFFLQWTETGSVIFTLNLKIVRGTNIN